MRPKEEMVKKGEHLDQSIRNAQEAVAFSEKVYELGKKVGLSKRNTMLMALGVEELACYTIEKGFQDGKKHSIDARVTVNE